jgi:putative hydrolase of the HAD superfamily
VIKNIIFDIGGVLVDFIPQKVAEEKLGIPKDIASKLMEKTVNSKWWVQLDIGVLSDEEIIEKMIADAPEYKEYIRLFFDKGKEMLVKEFDYSKKWILDLKDRGYKVYLLSNYPKNFFNIHSKYMSFVNDVDGKVVSGFVNMIKPQPEIYKCLLVKYNLVPSECVFIDDRMDNVEAARQVGINGIQFAGYEAANNELRTMGVNL